MQLYNGTGCLVFLVGNVTAMPIIAKKNSDAVIIVTRKRHNFENTIDTVEHYRVVLNPNDAYRIVKFGFPGMAISIRGDLRAENKAEIIAEKIDFIDFPGSNEFHEPSYMESIDPGIRFAEHEMSYWFTRDGSMRKELMYMH